MMMAIPSPRFKPNESLPGWSNHGGGGTAGIEKDSAGNPWLLLTADHNDRTHNLLYTPATAGLLEFSARLEGSALPAGKLVIGMHGRKELDENIRFARTYQNLSKQEMTDLLVQGKKLAKSWGTPYGPVA